MMGAMGEEDETAGRAGEDSCFSRERTRELHGLLSREDSSCNPHLPRLFRHSERPITYNIWRARPGNF